jgi:L-threonylcarbamoyladenylate synthase
VRGLFTAKGRSPEQPVAVLFLSAEAIAEALPDLDEAAARALEALLPGPFTFVVATRVPRPQHVGFADSLGVRVPDHPLLLRLLGVLGVPLAATSANLSGGKDAAILDEVDPLLLARCSLAFAGGGAPAGEGARSGGIAASTVIDLRPLSGGGEPVILREGAVPGRTVLEWIAALR